MICLQDAKSISIGISPVTGTNAVLVKWELGIWWLCRAVVKNHKE